MKLQPFRESAVSYFEALVDPEKRRMMGAIETFCIWFDDLNLTDLSKEKVEENFSPDEHRIICEFHDYFDGISDVFDTGRTWEIIKKDPTWIELTERAKVVLITLTPKTEQATGLNSEKRPAPQN